jgi:hypothetical protein
MLPPKKPINHAGAPHKSIIPKSAMFLMANEDRGLEDDQDPTDGGQGGSSDMGGASPSGSTDDATPTPPELASAMHKLIHQFGPEAVREACDEATNTDADDSGESPSGMQMNDGTGSY